MFRYIFLRAVSGQSQLLPFVSRSSSTITSALADPSSKDIQRIHSFTNPQVQNLLKTLTGRDYKRIFRARKIGEKLHEPKIKFMTEKQMEETMYETEKKAGELLQMPPVLPAAIYEEKVLSFDSRIQGHDESAFVFTDISLNSTDRERIIVVRDLDGTLRHAEPELRMKMNSIYFPLFEGRSMILPKMFSDPIIFKSVLDRASDYDNSYEYVLDRACLQFEPDDPQYVSIVERTFDHIDEKKNYDLLKSTRHYGPLVFYLTRTRKMDNLLIFNIQNERISFDAVPLVSLFTLIFPEATCKEKVEGSVDEIEKIRYYIQLDSIKKGELELSLNAYEEVKSRKEEMEKGLERAHGY